MPTYRLTLEYDGGAYSGWQRQPERPTVEGELRRALAHLGAATPPLTAASRTDAGAHAHGQVVGVTLDREWDAAQLTSALNAHLPEDVVVTEAHITASSFHARHDAQSRCYRYIVVPRKRRSPLTRRYAWYVEGDLDLAEMENGARRLVGTHDFGSFGRSPRPGGHTVRRVDSVSVRRMAVHSRGQSELDAVVIEVSANAFLYGMMRTIAGVLVAVGRGRLTADAVSDMLSAPENTGGRQVGVAPAHGLHQWTVTYA